ncbi:type 1 pili tip component [Pseudomaricurvus sp.]|uniref:type 1 pili tip component n=1 Tax=Pseudomaricurvus sp. TaxID=2004510 RepID=UPI003F6D4190
MEPFIDLTQKWSQFGQGELTPESYRIALSAADKAVLDKLCNRYPRLNCAEIIRDLLSAALRDMEQSIPYEKGNKVIATDEWGDEIYEDSGLTPRFLSLAKQYQAQLRGNAEATETNKDAPHSIASKES